MDIHVPPTRNLYCDAVKCSAVPYLTNVPIVRITMTTGRKRTVDGRAKRDGQLLPRMQSSPAHLSKVR